MGFRKPCKPHPKCQKSVPTARTWMECPLQPRLPRDGDSAGGSFCIREGTGVECYYGRFRWSYSHGGGRQPVPAYKGIRTGESSLSKGSCPGVLDTASRRIHPIRSWRSCGVCATAQTPNSRADRITDHSRHIGHHHLVRHSRIWSGYRLLGPDGTSSGGHVECLARPVG